MIPPSWNLVNQRRENWHHRCKINAVIRSYTAKRQKGCPEWLMTEWRSSGEKLAKPKRRSYGAVKKEKVENSQKEEKTMWKLRGKGNIGGTTGCALYRKCDGKENGNNEGRRWRGKASPDHEIVIFFLNFIFNVTGNQWTSLSSQVKYAL